MAARDKIDLVTLTIVEEGARFPAPGALKNRPAADVAAIHDDPDGFFTSKGLAPPDGTAGFGWWRRVDISEPLEYGETYGDPTAPVVDAANRRTTFMRAKNRLDPAAISARLHALEVELVGRINDGAVARRLDFITGGDGQEASYLRKEAQARAIHSPETPTIDVHGFVWREAAIDAADPDDPVEVAALARALAVVIVAKADTWEVIGSMIEAERKRGAKAVAAAKLGRDQVAENAMREAANINWSAIGIV